MTLKKASEKNVALREELLRVSEQLCTIRDQNGVGLTLHRFFPTLQHAFILQWVPEQAEDIYWILISPIEIVKVEIPRNRTFNNESISLQPMSVTMFQQKRFSREAKERLKIALELINS
jgi:hypothetical protein